METSSYPPHLGTMVLEPEFDMLGLHAKLATEMSALGLIGVGALHENTAVFKKIKVK